MARHWWLESIWRSDRHFLLVLDGFGSFNNHVQDFFLIWPTSASFLFIFVFFKQTLQFLQQINVKDVHPVSGTGILTHNLQIKSLLP